MGKRRPFPPVGPAYAQIWMRTLGLLKRPAKPSNAASPSKSVVGQPAAGVVTAVAVSATVGDAGTGNSTTAGAFSASASPASSRGGTPGPGPTAEEKRALAAAALAAARDASTAGSRLGKVAVTEVRRFAGKDIQVSKVPGCRTTVTAMIAVQNLQKQYYLGSDPVSSGPLAI